MNRSIYIGWDPREAAAYAVAQGSLIRHLTETIPVHGLVLNDLVSRGLYRRPTEVRDGRLWDVISDAPMSTEHACARFLTPHLAGSGWALFMDGDMLVREDLAPLFDALDPAKAVYCVHHHHAPPEGAKMDGQLQTSYARKNWSSFMVFNVGHPANDALTLDVVNSAPGRDLHRFGWLDDDLIGALDPRFNFLVPARPPAVAHFTEGTPDMLGYEASLFADEWRAELGRIAV